MTTRCVAQEEKWWAVRGLGELDLAIHRLASDRLTTEEQTFAGIEAELLLHHAAETTLRFTHAHAEPDPCPPVRPPGSSSTRIRTTPPSTVWRSALDSGRIARAAPIPSAELPETLRAGEQWQALERAMLRLVEEGVNIDSGAQRVGKSTPRPRSRRWPLPTTSPTAYPSA
jgi:hypothetical protein